MISLSICRLKKRKINGHQSQNVGSVQRRGSEFLRRMGATFGMTPKAPISINATSHNEDIEKPARGSSALSRLFYRESSAESVVSEGDTGRTTTDSSSSSSGSGGRKSSRVDGEGSASQVDEQNEEHRAAPSTPLRVRPPSGRCQLPSTAVITDPSLLFRYPEEIDPPPNDLKFFCLPGLS